RRFEAAGEDCQSFRTGSSPACGGKRRAATRELPSSAKQRRRQKNVDALETACPTARSGSLRAPPLRERGEESEAEIRLPPRFPSKVAATIVEMQTIGVVGMEGVMGSFELFAIDFLQALMAGLMVGGT